MAAIVEREGKIAVRANNVTYPAIAVLPGGRGVIGFALVGPDSSTTFVQFDRQGHWGSIVVAAAGRGPADGFSGYQAFASPDPALDRPVARWGDYGAAATDGNDIWIASEYFGQSCSCAAYADLAAFGSCGATRCLSGAGTRASVASASDAGTALSTCGARGVVCAALCVSW